MVYLLPRNQRGGLSVSDPNTQSEPRWLKTALKVTCTFVPQTCEQNYIWRRLQVSQQQAERQKKSILQQCLMFHSRADAITKDNVAFSNSSVVPPEFQPSDH